MRLTFICESLAMSVLFTTMPVVRAFALGNSGISQLSARDPLGLFQTRDDGCSSLGLSSDYTSCGMGLPNNFCCNSQQGETCMVFNNNQSVVCCPKGVDCEKFYQVGCLPQGLNVTSPGNSNSSIHSTIINGGLTTCSTGKCCPIGYLCDPSGGPLCIPGNATSTSTSSSAAASLSNAPAAGATASSSSSSSSEPTDNNQCPAFPTVAVLVGFFPGMILGILLTIITIVCLGRNTRKNRGAKELDADSPNLAIGPAGAGGFSRKVSEPIMQDSGATRVDFLRRMSRHRNGSSVRSPTVVGTPVRNSARVRSLFSGKRDPAGDDIPEIPTTPMSRIKREPSTETINVFSPANLHYNGGAAQSEAGSRDTRWDDVMAGAGGLGVTKGLAAPPAFLGSPGMVDPRKRGLDGTTQGFEPKRKY